MTAILPDTPSSNELHVLKLSGEAPISSLAAESITDLGDKAKVPASGPIFSSSTAAPAPVDARTHNVDVHPVAGNADALTKEADTQEQGFREQVSQIHTRE